MPEPKNVQDNTGGDRSRMYEYQLGSVTYIVERKHISDTPIVDIIENQIIESSAENYSFDQSELSDV